MVRQEVADYRVAGCQAQQAAGAYVRQRAVQRIVDAAQDDVGAVEEVPAGFGQVHALGGALEQQHAEHGLQLFDGRGDRRLGNIEVEGGLGDLADFGSGDKVAHLAQGK